MATCVTDDVNQALISARSHSMVLRTPGFLINYGLPAQVAQSLVRGGWSTIAELDTAERAWSAATNHGSDCSFEAWLEVPLFGVVGARHLRESLDRWRDHDPTPPPQPTAVTRLVLDIRARIASGEFGRGDRLPSMSAFVRAHRMRHTDVARAFDVLTLSGWCAWRNRPGAVKTQPRQCVVAILPGRPYDVRWPQETSNRLRRRAAGAVDLLRHNPGAWQANATFNILRSLKPIAAAEFDDAEEVLTVTALYLSL